MKKKKVLLIGWDAADWKIIDKLIEEGEMPTLERLINKGVMGNLATIDPPFSPMLWTSIATGKNADKHGVLGFIETDPATGQIRPVSSLSRKVKAIWNILTQKGYKTSLAGWWPSHPAEHINGVVVSNQFQKASKETGDNWRMSPGTVHPKEKSKEFKEMRIHPSELTAAHILPFVPRGGEVDQEEDKRIEGLAKVLAETSTVQATATKIMEEEEWDFMGVYFDGIDHFCHGFMDFHPPKMPNVKQEVFEIYKDVVRGAYKFHDMMLERQLQLAGPDATVILVSDHGFHSDHLRPKIISKEPAGPAQQHRSYGIIVAAGPNIKEDERIYGATLLDITPTILTALGLPIAKDMDGKPLMQIFKHPPEIKVIDSWENVEGECGMFPDDMKVEPFEVQAEIDQLVELGYIEKPGDNIQKSQETVQKETKYNLARVYMGSDRFGQAIPLLEELVASYSKEARFSIKLATCYNEINLLKESKQLIEKFRKDKIEELNDNSKLEELEENKEEKKEDDYKKERYGLLKEKAQIRMDLSTMDILEANILIKENKIDEAIAVFQKIEKTSNPTKSLYIKMGNAYTKIGKWTDAKNAFKNALEIDNDLAIGYHGLGLALLREGEYFEAIEQLLNAIGLLYHNPIAHYHLGEALYEAGYFERSAEAFEVTLAMNPNIGKARNWLIKLYKEKLNQPVKAKIHQDIIESIKSSDYTEVAKLEDQLEAPKNYRPLDESFYKNIEMSDPIYIVSGLPRSGTSMMMQMLVNGGIEPYVDNVREADESNPKGYYEHEAVMRLARDKKWLKDVRNKVVKVISQQLFHLPAKYNYKIVFMLRDINEIIQSQTKMLERQNKKIAKNYPYTLENIYQKNLGQVQRWAENNKNVSILVINHKDTIENPLETAKKVAEFIGKEKVNVEKMAEKVDKKLHRTKI